MSISSKRRFELHPGPQTWLGKLLNSEVDADARNEVLKWLTTKEVMRTHLLSKSALTSSPVALHACRKEIENAQEEEERADAQTEAALKAATTAAEVEAVAAEVEAVTAQASLRDHRQFMLEMVVLKQSQLHLRYWRMRLTALEHARALQGEVDSLKMKVVALKRLYQSKP